MGKQANKRKSPKQDPMADIAARIPGLIMIKNPPHVPVINYGPKVIGPNTAGGISFTLDAEVAKTLAAEPPPYSCRATDEDFNQIFPWTPGKPFTEFDVGFLFAIVDTDVANTPSISGCNPQAIRGKTVLSSYCTANHALRHYKAMQALPGIRSITYSTPKQHMILMEIL